MTTESRPAATPTYILRGHVAPIHALQIFSNNLRLASGDAEGWIVIWDLIFKRPVAVWKAHEGAVLEVKAFTLSTGRVTEIYTHGRDHKLRLWRIRAQDEEVLGKVLPVDAIQGQSKSQAQSQPWLVHSLMVNALNFCAFSMLFLPQSENPTLANEDGETGDVPPSASLVAVPNALDSGAIDLFHLPSERRVCTIPPNPSVKTGMVMAVRLVRRSSLNADGTGDGDLYVASAYEDGHVMVFACPGFLSASSSFTANPTHTTKQPKWETLYLSRPHTQPALSIDVAPSGEYFLSSSADANLVKHPIPILTSSSSSTREMPLKSVNTKHAGQQGLRVRSDGKIFATAGWDSRVRVYSVKTMKELAVLKWHKEGCYAVAFGEILNLDSATSDTNGVLGEEEQQQEQEDENERRIIHQPKEQYSLAQVQRQRNLKVQNTHWLVAGSKDGKISLWDIY
ncbi:WD40-repeat-containing domain protein [Aspergillus karnatakaensis]|uniref:WD40 repeat domain-containing protein n=1 Tax=Aspergillus karnatakaensis TaxID=1810916 RepID=UPI003CCD2AE3